MKPVSKCSHHKWQSYRSQPVLQLVHSNLVAHAPEDYDPELQTRNKNLDILSSYSGLHRIMYGGDSSESCQGSEYQVFAKLF